MPDRPAREKRPGASGETVRRRNRAPGLHVVSRSGSQSLYLQGTINGKRIFESAQTNDPKIAQEAAIVRSAELQRHAVHGTKPEVTFAEAVNKYVQHEPRSTATITAINKLVAHFGIKTTCRSIGQTEVDEAGDAICPGSKPQTIQRQVITPIKAILRFAAVRGWCGLPMFETRKGGGKRTEWITPAEAEAMIVGAAPHFKPVLIFLFCTGARVSEVVTLDWGSVNLQHAQATLRETKNDNDRVVDLPPRAVAALANMSGDRAGKVFLHPKNGLSDARMIPYRETNDGKTGAYGGQFKRPFGIALTNAGIVRHLTPHTARHSWATWRYAFHKDVMRLRDEGDWSSVALVERYTKTAPRGLSEAAAAFWGISVEEAQIMRGVA